MRPRSTCDLHIHTCYSDGRALPEEVVRQAASRGLTTIAITDHDNTRGFREARSVAHQLGIELIPAIEFTCRWDDCDCSPFSGDIDILGYFIDPDAQVFIETEEAALADIHQRIGLCCELLSSAGYPISLHDIFKHNPRYAGLMFLIDALVVKGYSPGRAEGLALVNRYYPSLTLSC
jgi:3',5'-nucleoside bisphosphate phosphatase